MNRVSETSDNVKKDVIQQINSVKDDLTKVSGTTDEAKTLAQQASDKAAAVETTTQGSVTSGAIVADTVSAKLKLNKVSGASEDSVIPIASASQTGMMNAQTYAGITNLNARVSALEGKNTNVYVTFPNNDPEQSIITSTFQTKAGRPPVAGDYAVDIALNLTYGYDGSVWVKVDTDVTIPQFSVDTPGLIKGNDEDGTVFAEADGTGSVKGWDALKQSVANNVTAIKQNSTAIEQNATATQAALDAKADVSALDAKADVSDLDRLMSQMMIRIDSDDLEMFKNSTLIYVLPIDATGCTSLASFFSGCRELRTVPFIRTPDVTDMNNMFCGCKKLTTVPEMNTSSVTNMTNMFYECSSLTTAPKMNTSSVTNMTEMFGGCKKLTTVPEMNTSSVTNMDSMFYNCSSLTTAPKMNTSSVTTMNNMFYNCSSLTTVPEMDMSSVTNITNMFYNCSSLVSVTFVGNRVPTYGFSMFSNTPISSGNGNIYVPDEMVDAYKAASGWSAHASVIRGISEKPN